MKALTNISKKHNINSAFTFLTKKKELLLKKERRIIVVLTPVIVALGGHHQPKCTKKAQKPAEDYKKFHQGWENAFKEEDPSRN